MATAGTLTVDLLAKTGSFETDTERAARTAERNAKRIGRAFQDAANDTERATRQAANSVRMVGPQITDIVTQLQGGQNPITILTQQGGQLKDMFGGVGPAAQAVGGYLAGLINPLTLTAAGVAALGYAFYLGSQQADAFNKAVQLSGNYAGVTAGQFDNLAKTLGESTGDVGKFRDILGALVASGQVASQNLAPFAQAISDISRLSGENADKVTADFLTMSKGVADWAAEHNRQYHFITEAEYEHIRALEQAGHAEEAMEVVARRLHDYLGRDATQNIGFLQQSYLGWKQVIDGTVQSLLSLGRAQTASDKLAKSIKEVGELEQRRDFFAGLGRDTGQIDAEIAARRAKLNTLNQSILDDQAAADKKAADARVQAAGIDAQRWIDAQLATLDKGYGKARALAEARKKFQDLVAANPNSPLATPATQSALEAGIAERFKPAKSDGQKAAEKAAREAAANEKAFQDAVARGLNAEAQDALRAEDAFQRAVTEGLNKEAQALTKAIDSLRTSLQSAEQAENESYAKRLESLKAYGEESAAAQAEANQLTEAESARHALALAQIQAQQQKDRDAFQTASTQSDQAQLQGVQQFTDTLYGVLQQSGQENSALGKTLFAASKALQVAQIIVAAETAAATTQAGLTAAAATTAALSGPAAPAVFAGLEANAIGQAMLVRAIGYANAGLVAGLAIAGQRANGGPVEAGKQYIVGERGREAFVPTTSGMIIPNHVLESGGKGGENITIVNNTRGRIDTVTTRQLSATERAIIIDEAISAVASDMANPNSRTSRAQSRNWNVQRSRA